MKVLVCGGRDFLDAKTVFDTLDSWHRARSITLVVHGDAKGADSLAKLWAISRDIPVKAYPANWELHGKAAGPVRNKQMLKEENPDVVLAFPGGRGTNNMVNLANFANVPVRFCE